MVEAKVVYSTSNDPNHPPSAVLDGDTENTFWMTGGLYPQHILISLSGLTHIETIRLKSFNVRHIVLEKSVNSKPTEFQEICDQDAVQEEGKLQNILVSSDLVSASYLRLTVTSGYGHFCSFHDLTITGPISKKGVTHATLILDGEESPVKKAPPTRAPPPPDPETSPIKLADLHHEDDTQPVYDGAKDINEEDYDEEDDDVDNASTFTQHGGSSTINLLDEDEEEDL